MCLSLYIRIGWSTVSKVTHRSSSTRTESLCESKLHLRSLIIFNKAEAASVLWFILELD